MVEDAGRSSQHPLRPPSTEPQAEGAYRRGTAVDRRRQLMAEWTQFLAG